MQPSFSNVSSHSQVPLTFTTVYISQNGGSAGNLHSNPPSVDPTMSLPCTAHRIKSLFTPSCVILITEPQHHWNHIHHKMSHSSQTVPTVTANIAGTKQQVNLRDYLNQRVAPFLKKAIHESLETEYVPTSSQVKSHHYYKVLKIPI